MKRHTPHHASWMLAAVVLTAAIATAALADTNRRPLPSILWDNFLTNPDGGGFDGWSYFSSERNTNVVESWAGDDAFFDVGVTVQGIGWAAIRDADYTYTAETIVLDDAFNELVSFTGLPFTALATYDWLFGYETYNGYVQTSPITLPAGHYYFAVRLAVDAAGRNMILSTGNGAINGLTEGAVQSEFFGIPDWSLFSQAFPGATPTDYAYRIHGFIDCNQNGVPDDDDIASGTSQDGNGNGIPDECEEFFALGDLDCSGSVDFDDINPFVLALSGQAAYEAQYPDCNWLNADCNGDGSVDFDDINAFVALLGS